MTADQKDIVRKLFHGYYLVRTVNFLGTPGYKLYREGARPERFIHNRTIRAIEQSARPHPLFKKGKRAMLTLNLSTVRRLHGNNSLYKMYCVQRENNKCNKQRK